MGGLPSAMSLVGRISEDGLGLVEWWGPEEEEEEEEGEDEEA